jgi:hypothetical protein
MLIKNLFLIIISIPTYIYSSEIPHYINNTISPISLEDIKKNHFNEYRKYKSYKGLIKKIRVNIQKIFLVFGFIMIIIMINKQKNIYIIKKGNPIPKNIEDLLKNHKNIIIRFQ